MSKKRKVDRKLDALRFGSRTVSLDGYLEKKTKGEDKSEGIAAHAQESADEAVKPGPKPNRSIEPFHSAVIGDSKYIETRKALPLWDYQDEIREALRDNNVLLLVGETGSGKSTQVPQFLYQEYWCQRKKVKVKSSPDTVEEVGVGGMIAITQPRRVAATTLAQRVSCEVGTPLERLNDVGGQSSHGAKGLVGYSVRFDHRVPRGTRIKFLTEGMLLQELLRDPHLRQYSAIIIDEIHERSVDVDLLCGFLKQLLSGDDAGRGGIPLKIVIMSATANIEATRHFFSASREEMRPESSISPRHGKDHGVQVLKIKGRQFPVEISHTPKPVPDIQEALLRTIFKIHAEEALPGDILAFLTGQEEIEAAQKLIEEYASTLASNLPRMRVLPLYGQLSMEAQHDAFRPIKGGFTRKIVLATNIAETSVTVPGVRYVVDCGKAKVKQFRPRLGMESLLAKPISQSSAIQRTGRAGREAPGKSYRLYTQETYDGLQKTDLPEILRTDVLGAVLTMKARGIDDIMSFPLMDMPDVEALQKALVHLHFLGALADDGRLTELGRKMITFPVSPQYARVLLAAADVHNDVLLEAIDIAAAVTAGEDLFQHVQSEEAREELETHRKGLTRREGDLITYLTTMQLYVAENSDRVQWCKARKINIRHMRQALNIRKQLRTLCIKEKLLEAVEESDGFTATSPERAVVILKCFLKGFAFKTAVLAPDNSYVTTHGKHVVAIHPSSVLHGQKKEAIMFLEHVFSSKNYAKKVSVIQASWVGEVFQE